MIAPVSYTLLGVISGILLWFLASASNHSFSLPSGDPPDESDVARLHEIRDQTAAVRGLDVAGEVREGYLSRENLALYVDSLYESLSGRERRELETLNTVMRMLRMIGPEDDLFELGAETDSLGLAGFYDYEHKRLVVISDLVGGANEEATLAHEYTHALQDRRFDLERFLSSPYDARSEYSTTLSCVIEGDASLAQIKYLEEVYGEDWLRVLLADLEDLEVELSSLLEAQASIPPAILRYTTFNYNECALFALEVWEEGGWEAVNALYEDPPSTTEQVMHPERYFEGEGTLPLELENIRASLGLGWKLAQSGAFGEFDLYNYLASAGLQPISAVSAAEGWGAGQLNVYTLGGGEGIDVLLHIALLWDDAAELDQFRGAFDTALTQLDYDNRDNDEAAWTWAGGGEYGAARWEEAAARVDLIYGTDETAVSRAMVRLSQAP
jgi:hypothetical protein